jgi:hypothetical protein
MVRPSNSLLVADVKLVEKEQYKYALTLFQRQSTTSNWKEHPKQYMPLEIRVLN